ncbi:hypothetical protein HAX54_038429 [Datura stramonium]|uniref:Uncharacterized protein n=1 Tax=Datura stramonium TaxID=4076 RepID=A0ABS8SI11_DATST|nr:hypothetical protein [Datura stramonium]
MTLKTLSRQKLNLLQQPKMLIKGVRNQPPINRRAPPVEEIDLEKTRCKVRSWKETGEEPRTANGQARNANRPRYIPEIIDNLMEFTSHPWFEENETRPRSLCVFFQCCACLGSSKPHHFVCEPWPTDAKQQPLIRMTSRRTSCPRTGKQSDPIDKGKVKEKRPAKDEAESRSDPKLEEALRKAKDEEERRVELHLKRGEDALRFNAVPGMKENSTEYLTKLENTEDHYTWIASLIAAGTPTWVTDGGFGHPKIQDEMNSKLKKRGREPVVSHAFETDMGIDSQDLEHRVSKLDSIGAREALTARKVDMRKVKTDVQQLQPNLSIFNVLLTKDEVSEEERAETYEERAGGGAGAGPSSRAPIGEDVATTKTTTLAQSEEAKDT